MRLGAKGALTLISISMSLAAAPAFSSPLAAGEAEEKSKRASRHVSAPALEIPEALRGGHSKQ